jgi:hypothetical protein
MVEKACISPPTTTASALASLKRMGSKPDGELLKELIGFNLIAITPVA